MARAKQSENPVDPTDDAAEVDETEDPEFAEGFGVFDPDEDSGLADGDDADAPDEDVLADADDDDIDVPAVLPLDDSQFDADDATETPLDADGAVEDEVEGVRRTEFVCSRCYLAKRLTQLADKKRSLCIDCV